MTETITWIDAATDIPDDDTTVLVYIPREDDEPVWLGYHEDDMWFAIDGAELHGVTHWAHVPAGPDAEDHPHD